MQGKTILLIVGGGIAAFKSLELVRELRRAGAHVTPVLTEGGAHFVTALSLGALAEARVRTSLWDLDDEASMGHIALSRSADLIVVCPATADLMARAATGQANDLASTLLLATDTPVLMVPAMNVRMWRHAATVRNVARLRADGAQVLEPDVGPMACGEFGPGRLPAVPAIMTAIAAQLGGDRLTGKHALVTAGPTHEAIDPVRFLGNRSSGKQGFAIAAALAREGASVTLVAGPVNLPTPSGVTRVDVESAREMADAVNAALPADVSVMVAAVADWRVEAAAAKLKKSAAAAPPSLTLVENPDILASVGHATNRPRLVIGFAAETGDLIANANAKLAKKGADWIIANDVSTGVFGEDSNHVHLVSAAGTEDWGTASKDAIATRLAAGSQTRLADPRILAPRILVDADACPVKDDIYRVAIRHNVPVVVVSNSGMRLPAHPLLSQVMVSDGFDAADDWIAEQAGAATLVITGDILLADRALKAGSAVLAHNGRAFTTSSIGAAIATRAIMADLRAGGDVVPGGPSAFSKEDRSRFLQSLDGALVRLKQQGSGA